MGYKTIRVLWFSNTPSLASEKLNGSLVFGGWIKSLEKELKKYSNVKLGIAFYWPLQLDSFEYNGTEYFPIYSGRRNKFTKLYKRILGKVESTKDVKNYIDIINLFKPDLIHIHGTEMPFGLIQKYIKTPAVVSIQGNLTVCVYKYFSGISKNTVNSNSNIFNKLLARTPINSYKNFQKRAKTEKEILKYSKNIIGRTNWDYRITRLLAKDAIYFHNDEILRDAFYSNKWDNDLNGVLRIFTTSGTELYKGIETIIYTANLLEEYGINFEWKIAGILSNDSIVKFALYSQGITISSKIKFLGKLDEKALVEELLNTNIYVMASHIENSPNNLCEAMILGIPSIATNAGGTGSLLQERETGLLVQDGDPYVLAGALIELLSNYKLAKQYGKLAREVALIRHDKNRITKELLEIYYKILG